MQLAAGHYCSLNNFCRAGGTHEGIKTAGGILGSCFRISPSMIEECFCCWVFPFEAVADLVMGISCMHACSQHTPATMCCQLHYFSTGPAPLILKERIGKQKHRDLNPQNRRSCFVWSFPSNWFGIRTRTSVIFFCNDDVRFVLCSWANSWKRGTMASAGKKVVRCKTVILASYPKGCVKRRIWKLWRRRWIWRWKKATLHWTSLHLPRSLLSRTHAGRQTWSLLSPIPTRKSELHQLHHCKA